MIEFRDIAVCYDPHGRDPQHALEGIDLSIADGEWVFVVGPSGAGKSTLLKLVYHGAIATRGSVLVDGQDITSLAPREVPYLRRKVGVVFQDFQLLPQKTVWENVAFALQVIGAPQKRMVRDVPRALETVGLHNKATARPHELSGGEQQRVAIARAIVNNPRILIADEPTGNLDPATAEDIGAVLARINESGTTIVMASHDRHLVDTLRKRVVRIAAGRVAGDDLAGVYHAEDDDPRVAHVAVAAAPIVSPASRPMPAAVHREPEHRAAEHHESETAEEGENTTAAIPVAESGIRRSAGPTRLPDHDRPLPEVRGADEPGYVHRSRENPSPIGSADNPIVLLDRADSTPSRDNDR